MASEPSDLLGWDLESPPETNDNEESNLLSSTFSTAAKREPIKCVSMGEHHIAMVTAEGFLLTYGKGPDGELGLGESILCTNVPMQAYNFRCTTFSLVSCGIRHTAAISLTGKLLTWGSGFRGVLGSGKREIYTSQAL